MLVYVSDGTGKCPQVPDNGRSPAFDGVPADCPTDGVVQAMPEPAGVRQTSGAVDSETAVHRVLRHVQLPCSQRHPSSPCCHDVCRGLVYQFVRFMCVSFSSFFTHILMYCLQRFDTVD